MGALCLFSDGPPYMLHQNEKQEKQAGAELCEAKHSLNQLLTSYQLLSLCKDCLLHSTVLIKMTAAEKLTFLGGWGVEGLIKWK